MSHGVSLQLLNKKVERSYGSSRARPAWHWPPSLRSRVVKVCGLSLEAVEVVPNIPES